MRHHEPAHFRVRFPCGCSLKLTEFTQGRFERVGVWEGSFGFYTNVAGVAKLSTLFPYGSIKMSYICIHKTHVGGSV